MSCSISGRMSTSPTYSLTPIVRRSRIDPGGVVEIELYIAGHGPVEASKLQVFHVQDDLIDRDSPGEFVRSVDSKSSISGKRILIRGEDARDEFEIDSWNTVIMLQDWFFENIPRKSDGEPLPASDIGVKLSEGVHDDHPPLLLRLRVSPAAEPGTYTLPMVFTYVSDGHVEQDSETVSIRVTNWVDRYRTELEILGVLGVVATVLTVLIMAL